MHFIFYALTFCGVAMKNLIYTLIISLIIIVFIPLEISYGQISRNPDPGRPVSRIPRPADGGNISDRNRDEETGNTKDRKNPPPQINIPVAL